MRPAFDDAVRASVIAVSDAEGVQYVGFTRNGFEALRRCLFRAPQRAQFVQVENVYVKPTSFVLSGIQSQWIEELGQTPPGNGPEKALWEDPINVRELLTANERVAFAAAEDEEAWRAVLASAGERAFKERLEVLSALGSREPFEADPKSLRRGLLEPVPRTPTRCGPPPPGARPGGAACSA